MPSTVIHATFRCFSTSSFFTVSKWIFKCLIPNVIYERCSFYRYVYHWVFKRFSKNVFGKLWNFDPNTQVPTFLQDIWIIKSFPLWTTVSESVFIDDFSHMVAISEKAGWKLSSQLDYLNCLPQLHNFIVDIFHSIWIINKCNIYGKTK